MGEPGIVHNVELAAEAPTPCAGRNTDIYVHIFAELSSGLGYCHSVHLVLNISIPSI